MQDPTLLSFVLLLSAHHSCPLWSFGTRSSLVCRMSSWLGAISVKVHHSSSKQDASSHCGLPHGSKPAHPNWGMQIHLNFLVSTLQFQSRPEAHQKGPSYFLKSGCSGLQHSSDWPAPENCVKSVPGNRFFFSTSIHVTANLLLHN